MEKSLDRKLETIRNGTYKPSDFIIADAKDGDMGGGITAFGQEPGGSGRSVSFPDHLNAMREMTESGLVDIMLMSSSATERLVEEGVFKSSAVTPAARFNDTTDIWGPRHSNYKAAAARNFQTARLHNLENLVDLGLYSITFSNDLDRDLDSLEQFQLFLDDLSDTKLTYFLEIFNPQIETGIGAAGLGEYVNDCIVRCLAGLTRADQPQFLKMPFNGPRAMEEICRYDPGHLIVGVLGSAVNTTRDTFEYIRQSEKYGARVALFGRKILFTEDPVEIVRMLREIIQGEIGTEEAVKAYHGYLAKKGIPAFRSLEDDQKIVDPALFHDL